MWAERTILPGGRRASGIELSRTEGGQDPTILHRIWVRKDQASVLTSSCTIPCVVDKAAGRKKDTAIDFDSGRNVKIAVGIKRALKIECRTGMR